MPSTLPLNIAFRAINQPIDAMNQQITVRTLNIAVYVWRKHAVGFAGRLPSFEISNCLFGCGLAAIFPRAKFLFPPVLISPGWEGRCSAGPQATSSDLTAKLCCFRNAFSELSPPVEFLFGVFMFGGGSSSFRPARRL